MLGPFATTSRLTPIHQMSLAVLSCAACASMSTTTTTTTTTTRDRGDRYGPMEWAQFNASKVYRARSASLPSGLNKFPATQVASHLDHAQLLLVPLYCTQKTSCWYQWYCDGVTCPTRVEGLSGVIWSRPMRVRSVTQTPTSLACVHFMVDVFQSELLVLQNCEYCII